MRLLAAVVATLTVSQVILLRDPCDELVAQASDEASSLFTGSNSDVE